MGRSVLGPRAIEHGVAELEKSELEALVAQAKRQIRARMKGLRGALPPAALAARSAKVVERLREVPALMAAKSVALFWPITRKSEIDLRPLMNEGDAQRKVLEPFYRTNRPSWRDQQLPPGKGPSL